MYAVIHVGEAKIERVITVKHKQKPAHNKIGKTYITQPISQADARQNQTQVALPNDINVERNREWVEENKK